MIHVESFKMTYPPFSNVLKLVWSYFCLKVSSLQDIGDLGF